VRYLGNDFRAIFDSYSFCAVFADFKRNYTQLANNP